jgi:hypothetical protein
MNYKINLLSLKILNGQSSRLVLGIYQPVSSNTCREGLPLLFLIQTLSADTTVMWSVWCIQKSLKIWNCKIG